MIAEALVGIQKLADGALARLRQTTSGALVVASGAPDYQELAARGQLYSAVTAKTGVAPGTDIGTTAAFALANPYDSGVDLYVVDVSVGYVSGTLGAGYIAECGIQQGSTAVTGTAITVAPAKIGAPVGAGKAFTTATIVSPLQIGVLASLGASLATTAVNPWTIRKARHGMVRIPPGANYSLQGVAAAGTSPLVVFECVWIEVPV